MPDSDTIRGILVRLGFAVAATVLLVGAERVGLLAEAPGRGRVVPLVAVVIVGSWLLLAVIGLVALARRIRSGT
ncbi:hypothetical protein J2751_001233 [Halorubrum alkaliphilum]|uniref:Uncharacterized protein n=1 Tax=Halorubrum alkaliphilum TaxID=261290 RepID=A0A8T4GES0_9EURY|nr:hypothetical protein [Halorubrum alkaliphilum]MBP1922227.1 hypothetical protein [Halorubrum alkaliphilum]